MAKIIFYCHDTRENIDLFDYYKQDIDALKALGHDVLICTRYRDIPLKFDLIFIWWWTHALIPVLLAGLLGRPSIVTGTYNFRFPAGFKGDDYFARPNWQKFLIAASTRLSSFNLFVNDTEMHECKEYFGLRNVGYIPHIVSSDCLKGPGPNRQLVLFNIAWSGRKNLIRKGIPELIKALGILKSDFPELKLWLGGKPGDGADWLLEMARINGVESQIEWLGSLSHHQKASLLRSAEIYVQPSHYEGFGLAIAEAMGSGACVITCDVGAVRSVVGECGIYVEPGNALELAEGIRRILLDGTLRRKLQERATSRVNHLFSFDTKVKLLENYLHQLRVK